VPKKALENGTPGEYIEKHLFTIAQTKYSQNTKVNIGGDGYTLPRYFLLKQWF
jgi:hypothetical protein